MAGIGFVLRKLMKQSDLSSLIVAYFHSTMASAGPWIITILALGSFFLLGRSFSSNEAYIEFRLIILFNFSLSLVIAAPITNCSTRYLADIIYLRMPEKGAGLMIGMLYIVFFVGLPVASVYYIFFTAMSLAEKFQAIFNFMLIAAIWHAGVFISALKYYRAITLSFIFGMLLSVLGAMWLAFDYSMMGMLAGFNGGLAFILASLIALVLIEYPPSIEDMFKVVTYFKKYWEIALGFLAYATGLWVDKWIMWFSPESVQLPNQMRMYPDYDSAMFISYLTVIPAMALFLLTQETSFYMAYLRFYSGIQNHDSFERIHKNHRELSKTVSYMGRNLLLLQGFICLITLILAPYLFQILGINLIQIGMFRAGVLGAAFQILSLFIMVLLAYFDNRKGLLLLQLFFFLSNALLTLFSLKGGIAFYGYGFFAASLLTFLLGAIILERYLRVLPYHTFVTQNIIPLQQHSKLS